MKYLPQSLAGQLILLLIAGLFATHLITQPLTGHRIGSIHQVARGPMLERYAAIYRVISVCEAGCNRNTLIAALNSRDTRFRLSEEHADIPAPLTKEEKNMAAQLATILPDQKNISLSIGKEQRPDSNESFPVIYIESTLPDGIFLRAALWPAIRDSWVRPLKSGLLYTGLPILILVALFTRRLLKPLNAMTLAAEKISRGERIAPLTINSPKEIREVAMAFNTMQERLTRFVSGRTNMLASISHDFRTPITSLRLRAEMIDDRELRNHMIRTINEMGQMVEETLRFVRDDSMQEESSETDLHELLDSIVQEQLTLGRKIQLTSHDTLLYRCHPMAIKRAVRNIAENALHYGSQAIISVQKTADTVCIYVEDNGPGLAEEWLEKVFEPFVRPDEQGRSRSTGGSGLGLAIARSVINAHGGTLELKNLREGGLQAIIRLPA